MGGNVQREGAEAARSRPAVCVLGSDPEQVEACLSRIRQHTSADVPVFVESSPEALFEAAAGHDMALVAPEALVCSGWLDRLRDAALSDTTIGTASALDAATLGVPVDDLDSVAAEVAARSLRLRPRVAETSRLCVYMRKPAIDLCFHGDLHVFFRHCLAHGLQHVIADDVLVGGERGTPLPVPERSAAARAVGVARRATRGLTLAIDARSVGPVLSGAQIHVLELAAAVARTGKAQVRVVVTEQAGPDARAMIDRLEGAEVVMEGDAVARADVVHRPHQLGSFEDLIALRSLGERLVVTQQDLIAYRNPAYHPGPPEEAWQQYRRVTRLSLATADAVVFSSSHARDDALADDLVEPDRSHVLPIGVSRASAAPSPPADAPPEPFLLQLGNDFLHKNRPWAVRLLAELRSRGWEGSLVLAGPKASVGSSSGAEEPVEGVLRLGEVSEAEKSWLYTHCAAVLYPTTYEGFGLVPFEAAAAGVPCLFAAVASLAETLPAEAATLVPWDPAASADRVLPLLGDGDERRAHVALLRSAAERLPDWDEHAAALLDVYEEAARSPFREAAVVAWDSLAAELELKAWRDLRDELGADGFNLVRPGGYLDAERQKALLSIVTRNRLRGPFFAALDRFYRLGKRARGGRS